MANAFYRQFAYQVRISAELDDRPLPNRQQIRDTLRHEAPKGLRRCVFGLWRRSPEWTTT